MARNVESTDNRAMLSQPMRRARLGVVFLVIIVAFVSSGARVHDAQAQAKNNVTSTHEPDADALAKLGEKKLAEKRFEAALAAFEKSHALSRRVTTQLGLAEAIVGLGQHARAYNVIALVEADPTIDAATAERVRALRETCAAKIGILSIKLLGEPAGAVRVTVGDVDVALGKGVGVEPGVVQVKLFSRAEGAADETLSLTREVEVSAGKGQVVELAIGSLAKRAPEPAPTLLDCAATAACSERGRCVANGSRCVANRTKDCLRSSDCRLRKKNCALRAEWGACGEERKIEKSRAKITPTSNEPSGLGTAGWVFLSGGLSFGTSSLACLLAEGNEDTTDDDRKNCASVLAGIGAGLIAIGVPMLIASGLESSSANTRMTRRWQAHVGPMAGGAFVQVVGDF